MSTSEMLSESIRDFASSSELQLVRILAPIIKILSDVISKKVTKSLVSKILLEKYNFKRKMERVFSVADGQVGLPMISAM
jgi:hypothetical protein